MPFASSIGLAVALLQATAQAPAGPQPVAPAASDQAGSPGQGAVVLECVVDDERRLRSCAVRSETPAGLGYGQAALSTAARASNPQERYRGLEGRRVRFTVRFTLAK